MNPKEINYAKLFENLKSYSFMEGSLGNTILQAYECLVYQTARADSLEAQVKLLREALEVHGEECEEIKKTVARLRAKSNIGKEA